MSVPAAGVADALSEDPVLDGAAMGPAATGRAPAPPEGTSTAPTARTLWLRARAPLGVVALLVAVGIVAALVRGGGTDRSLDPSSAGPSGSRALARLLTDRGVDVRVAGSVPDVARDLTGEARLLLPDPAALADDELRRLQALARDRRARLVVVGAGDRETQVLAPGTGTSTTDEAVREPACDDPAARTAGRAQTGGTTYAGGDGGVGCYASAGEPSLLVRPDGLVLLGSGLALTNGHLGQEGNAALALGLLDPRLSGGGAAGPATLVWLLPAAGRDRGDGGGGSSLSQLLPRAVGLGLLQVLVAVVLLALARGRRLGRVVPERLPVVVRSAEAVEGRGRLYRAARARDAAAQALQAGARDRLARRTGLPPGSGAPALVSTVAGRTGRAEGEVARLLLGPAPADDPGLVRLADDLDELVDRVEHPG